MTKYYVDKNGDYLGAFVGRLPNVDAVEVTAPFDGRQKYDLVNNNWLPLDGIIIAKQEILKLELMITKRAIREGIQRGDGKIIGYLNGMIYMNDVEAEIARLERDIIGR